MKKLSFLFALAIISFTASAQNEFANEKFYSAVKKIYTDGQNGFVLYKGAKLRDLGSLISFYKITLLLPGVDSGNISFSQYTSPAANFDFKPTKTYEQAGQKIKNLAAAVKIAAGKTLYEQHTTDRVKNYTYYKTLLYTMPDPGYFDNADFELYTVLDKGVYAINLQIRGAVPAPVKTSKLRADNNLQAEIKTILNDVDNFFTTEKTTPKEKGAYSNDLLFKSRTQLFGLNGEVKENQYKVEWSLLIDDNSLSGADESKSTYEKLKAACLALGVNFGTETTEDGHKDVYAGSMKTVSGKQYSVIVSSYFKTSWNMVTLTVSRYK